MSDIIQNMSDIFFLCSHVGVKNCNTVFITQGNRIMLINLIKFEATIA